MSVMTIALITLHRFLCAASATSQHHEHRPRGERASLGTEYRKTKVARASSPTLFIASRAADSAMVITNILVICVHLCRSFTHSHPIILSSRPSPLPRFLSGSQSCSLIGHTTLLTRKCHFILIWWLLLMSLQGHAD